MKITEQLGVNTEQQQTKKKTEKLPAQPEIKEELAAILERSNQKNLAALQKGGGPSDNAGSLTQRLVAAQRQDSVRLVISEAYKSLGEWLKAAMSGEGQDAQKAFAVIKKLHRVIRRAIRKIADLNKEDALRAKQKQAEKKHQEFDARKFAAERKRRVSERKQREHTYLQGVFAKDNLPARPKPLSLSELQAKIQALAAEMTALATSALPEGTLSAGGETAGAEAPAAE